MDQFTRLSELLYLSLTSMPPRTVPLEAGAGKVNSSPAIDMTGDNSQINISESRCCPS
jgi:hypothetical protein